MFIKNYKSFEDGMTEVKYEVPPKNPGDKPPQRSCKENDPVTEAFAEALFTLRKTFIKLAEQNADPKDVKIKEVKFKKTGKEAITQFMIVGLVGLGKSSGYNEVKTVYYYTSKPDESAGANVCSADVSANIDAIIDGCQGYVKGDRLQVEADLETEPEANAEDSEY